MKSRVDELMRQYQDEEIDGGTFFQKIMELNKESQNRSDEEYEK